MAWPCRIVLDVSPQPHNEVVNGSSVGVFLQLTYFIEHSFSGDRLALMLDQITKEVRLHQRQSKDLAADAEFQKIEIERFIAIFTKCKNVFCLLGRCRVVSRYLQPLSPTKQTPNSGNQNG